MNGDGEVADQAMTDGAVIEKLDNLAEPEPFVGDDNEGLSEPRRIGSRRMSTIRENEKGDIDDQPDESVPYKSRLQELWQLIRPGYVLDHIDVRSFQTAFRTWVVVWVAFLLLLINKTEVWLNAANYVLPIVGFMLACGGQPIILTFVMGIGALFICGISVAHFAIASAIVANLRGQPTLTEVATKIVEQGLCPNDPTLPACAEALVLSGHFLEFRYTAIFVVANIICIMILLMLRRKTPLLTIPYVLGAITICVTGVYGAAFPYFAVSELSNLDLLTQILVLRPIGLALALSFSASCLIFPLTANFAYFGTVLKALVPLKAVVHQHNDLLRRAKPSAGDLSQFSCITTATNGIQIGAPIRDMMASLSRLEVSYGRVDSGDVGEFRALFNSLILSISTYSLFYSRVELQMKAHQEGLAPAETHSDQADKSRIIPDVYHKTQQPVGEFEANRKLQLLKQIQKDTDEYITPEIADSLFVRFSTHFGTLLDANEAGMGALLQWVVAMNEFRFFSFVHRSKSKAAQKAAHESIQAAHQLISGALLELDNKNWADILKSELEGGAPPASLLAYGATLGFLTRRVSAILLSIFNLCVSIDDHNPTPRLVLPFQKTDRKQTRFININHTGEGHDDITGFSSEKHTQTRDPDASPPRTIFHWIGIRFLKVYNQLLDPYVFFAFRSAVFVQITAVPFFCKSTAGWFENNRLIWAVVMAAISTSHLPGDVVYSFLMKLIYTFIACVVAGFGWYISTGEGNGNHFGLGAVAGVIFFFLVFYRHFSVHLSPVPAIVLCSTVALVLGSSWRDAKDPAASSLGKGFHPAWVRFVTVAVGLTMGFLASVLPRPRTGKKAVRVTVAEVLRAIGNLHCEVGKFGVQRSKDANVHIASRNDPVVVAVRDVIVKLSQLRPLIGTLRYEPSLTGHWPKNKYLRLMRLEIDICQLYYGLYIALDLTTDPQLTVPVMMSRYGWTNNELSTDFFAAIHMASGSLMTGSALPRVSPGQMTEAHYRLLHENWGVTVDSLNRKIGDQLARHHRMSTNVSDEVTRASSSSGDESSIPITPNGQIEYLTRDGQLSLVGLMLSRMIYERMDEFLIVVKTLVGEEFDVDEELTEDDPASYFERARLLV